MIVTSNTGSFARHMLPGRNNHKTVKDAVPVNRKER
jgi:hypothetical protein